MWTGSYLDNLTGVLGELLTEINCWIVLLFSFIFLTVLVVDLGGFSDVSIFRFFIKLLGSSWDFFGVLSFVGPLNFM